MKKLYLLLLMILLSMTPAMAASYCYLHGDFFHDNNYEDVNMTEKSGEWVAVLTSTRNANFSICYNAGNGDKWLKSTSENTTVNFSGDSYSNAVKENGGDWWLPNAGTYTFRYNPGTGILVVEKGDTTQGGSQHVPYQVIGNNSALGGDWQTTTAPDMTPCEVKIGNVTYTYSFELKAEYGVWKILTERSWGNTSYHVTNSTTNTELTAETGDNNSPAVTATLYFSPDANKIYLATAPVQTEYDYWINGVLWNTTENDWTAKKLDYNETTKKYTGTWTTANITGSQAGEFGIRRTIKGETNQDKWLYNAGGKAAVTLNQAMNVVIESGNNGGNWTGLQKNTRYTFEFDPEAMTLTVIPEAMTYYYINGTLWSTTAGAVSDKAMTRNGDVYTLTASTVDFATTGTNPGKFRILKRVTSNGVNTDTYFYADAANKNVELGTAMSTVSSTETTGNQWGGMYRSAEYRFEFNPTTGKLTVTCNTPTKYYLYNNLLGTSGTPSETAMTFDNNIASWEGTVTATHTSSLCFSVRAKVGNSVVTRFVSTNPNGVTSTYVPVVFAPATNPVNAGTATTKMWTGLTKTMKYRIDLNVATNELTVTPIVADYYLRGEVNNWGGSGYGQSDYKFEYSAEGWTKTDGQTTRVYHYRYTFNRGTEQLGKFKIVGQNSWTGDSDCWGNDAATDDGLPIRTATEFRLYHRSKSYGDLSSTLKEGTVYFEPLSSSEAYIFISDPKGYDVKPDPENTDWYLRSTSNNWTPDPNVHKFTKLDEPVELEGIEYWYVYEWNERTTEVGVKISAKAENTDELNYGVFYSGEYTKLAANVPFPLNASCHTGDEFIIRKGYEGKLYFQPIGRDEAYVFLQWDDSFKPEEHDYYLRSNLNNWVGENHKFMPTEWTSPGTTDEDGNYHEGHLYTHYITLKFNNDNISLYEFKIVTENQMKNEDVNDRDTWCSEVPGNMPLRTDFLASKIAGSGHNLSAERVGWVTIYFNPSTNYIYLDADAPAIPFYLVGDINEWQNVRGVDSKPVETLYDDAHREISRETFDSMWRFNPVTENDFINEPGWFRLAVPATRDGHKRLCGQFAITDGQWNTGSDAHEFKASFNASGIDRNKALIHMLLKEKQAVNDNANFTAAQKQKISNQIDAKIKRIKTDYDFNEAINEDNIAKMQVYFDKHPIKAYNINDLKTFDFDNDELFYHAVHPIKANDAYNMNMLLADNAIENAVIYFYPGTLSTDAESGNPTDSKIIIFGTPVQQYIYYYAADKVENDEFKLFSTISVESNAVENYYLDYTNTVTTQFEKIVNGVSEETGEEVGSLVYKNMTYPTYWRCRIPAGFEHRRSPDTNSHKVYTFTATVTDQAGNEITQEDIDCDNIYLLEDMNYHAYFRVSGADKYNGVKSVTVKVMRATADGSDLEPVSASRYPNLKGDDNRELATKTVTIDGTSWRVPATSTAANADEILIPGALGQAYLVYTVTYNNNNTEYYYRPQDNNPKSRWIQMDNEDKYTVIYLNNRDIAINRLFFSHLPGTYYTDRHSDVQVSVEAYVEGKLYTKTGTTGELEFQYAIGDDVNDQADDSNLTYSRWSSVDSYTFDESNFDNNVNDKKFIYARIRHKENPDYTQTAYAAFPVLGSAGEVENRFAFEQYDEEGGKFIEFYKKGECPHDHNGVDADGNEVFIKKEDMPQHYLIRYSNVSDETPNGRPVKVELIKYDNGQKQGYWHEDQGDGKGRYWVDVKDTIFRHTNNKSEEFNEIVFTTLNFGPVMYRIIVTPTTTTPAKARAKAPASRAADDNGYLDMEGKTGIAYNLMVTTDNTTGVEEMEVVPAEYDGDAYYYNLQGIRVDNPAHGQIYIEVRGSEVRKVIL